MSNKIFFIGSLFCLALGGRAFAYALGNVELKPVASLSEVYDDNITYSNHNRISDFITQSLLGVSANYAGKTANFTFVGALRYDVFAENPSFDNLSENFVLNAKKDLSQYDSLSFSNSFNHAQEPRSFEDEFGRTNGRYSYYYNNTTTAYSRDLSQNLSFDLHETHELLVYSRNNISDAYLDKIGSAWHYAYNPETVALLSYDYSLSHFDPGTSMSEHTVTIGARRYLTNQFYVEGDSGVDIFTSFAKRSYVEPLFSVTLNDTVDNVTVAGLNFTKEYSPNLYSEDVLDAWRISANIQRQLFARLAGNMNFFWGQGTYITSKTKDDLIGAKVGLAYDLSPKVQLLVDYSYSHVSSNIDSREYYRNSTRLGVKVSF